MSTETKILTDEQIEQGRQTIFSTDNPFCPCDSKTMRKAARWAEQAILQSPQIQQWKKDAGRYRHIRPGDAMVWCSCGDDLLTGDCLDAEIDASMDVHGG